MKTCKQVTRIFTRQGMWRSLTIRPSAGESAWSTKTTPTRWARRRVKPWPAKRLRTITFPSFTRTYSTWVSRLWASWIPALKLSRIGRRLNAKASSITSIKAEFEACCFGTFLARWIRRANSSPTPDHLKDRILKAACPQCNQPLFTPRRAHAVAHSVPKGSNPVFHARKLPRALRRDGTLHAGAQEIHHRQRGHARRSLVDGVKSHAALAVDYEDGGFSNPSHFPFVQDSPRRDQSPFGVTKDREWQAQIKPHIFGFSRLIDRDCGHVNSGEPDVLVLVAILRQLAETERSPMAAIKNEYARAARGQLGKPPLLPPGIE